MSGVPVARRVTLRCSSEGGFQMGQEGREKRQLLLGDNSTNLEMERDC